MIFENFMFFMSKIFAFSAYVNTASGFPKPLSAEEEKDCFARMKAGDESAKEKLICHNLRLVAHIVKKYTNAGEADDLLSVGSIGLIKAVNSYEYGKGTQLSTYAARCIENEILMLIRANKKHKTVLNMSDVLGQDKDGNEMEIFDIIADEHDYYNDADNAIVTDQLLGIIETKMNKREGLVIKHRYGLAGYKPLTQRELANELKISRSYISRLETKALEFLRKEVEKDSGENHDLS